jgi:RNA-directed DNA polymerase
MSLLLSASEEELRNQFLALNTRQDVARLLEVDDSLLIYHLYIVSVAKKYTTFYIPKKSGTSREIKAPATALKIIQQKLNQVLLCIYQPKPSVHGFVPERSIVTNAKMHCSKEWVLNIDLKDFFPSINFGRVRGMFMAFPYELNESIATILAQICCFDNALPQGAPTSPIVSNMLCAKMDAQLQRLAQKHRCYYTRYADDITFSTSLRVFPYALAGITPTGKIEVGDELRRIIKENGFEINTSKVRLQKRNRRQEVTGLTTNEKPNVRRNYVRQIRAMLYAWQNFGLAAAEKEFLTRYGKKHRGPCKQPPSFQQIVKGKIEFLGMVKGKDDPIYLRFLAQLRNLDPNLVKGPIYPREALLKKFDDLVKTRDPQKRGYKLQDLLMETFELYGLSLEKPFTRNQGAEQIDGAFVFEGWHYIVECRWRKKAADIRELAGLTSQVDRSGRQTMGLFLSVKGWSQRVPSSLKENPNKATILMNGDDLHSVLEGRIDLQSLIRVKIRHLNFKGEPFCGAEQCLKESKHLKV